MDYVRSDVWGASKTPSLGEKHYFVTFVDDFSRRLWVYTMKTKDEVLGIFLKWKAMIETHSKWQKDQVSSHRQWWRIQK